MRKKVCHFTIVHPLDDARIFHKECKSLAKHYDVTLVTTADFSGDYQGINVVGIGFPTGILNRVKRIFSIIPLLLKQKADIYHFHDPELIFTGYILKKFYGRKVVYDVHEHYTSKLSGKTFGKLRWFKKPLISTWSYIEKKLANQLDLAVAADSFTVTQFTGTRAISIGNFPPISFVNGVQPQPLQLPEGEFRVVYVGTIHELRGLRQCVEAVQKVKYPNVTLHIIGACKYPELTKLFTTSERVVYHGRISWEKMSEELSKCRVGLALLQPVPQFTYCPGENVVKLFEYAGMGIPYLISDFPRLSEFVNENGGGLLVDPTDTDKIAAAIEKLYEDRQFHHDLSVEGIEMVRNKFNWDVQEKKLLDAYEEVLQEGVQVTK